MDSALDEYFIPLLVTNHHPAVLLVNRQQALIKGWSTVLGIIFGVFLHLSVVGSSFVLHWWLPVAGLTMKYHDTTTSTSSSLVDIAWTMVCTLIISLLAALFFWSFLQVVDLVKPEASKDLCDMIEIRFSMGCLATLAVLEFVCVLGRILITNSVIENRPIPVFNVVALYLIVVVIGAIYGLVSVSYDDNRVPARVLGYDNYLKASQL